MAPPRLITCHAGHNNWRNNARGDRECRDCHNARRRVSRTQVRRAKDSLLWDTLTYAEFMKARGYDAVQ